MIINLWSTPRTGSVWYSQHLSLTYGCNRITEIFNPHHFQIYKRIVDGVVHNHSEYQDGYRYEEFYIEDGLLETKHVFAPRHRNQDEEFTYRKSLMSELSTQNRLVFHNHIHPLDNDVREHLSSIADKNIYIYRKDRLAQLASFTIAIASHRFAQITPSRDDYPVVDKVPEERIRDLCERIRVWDAHPKDNGEVIAYEDIEFYDGEQMLKKQVKDYTTILTDSALSHLERILHEEGLCKL